MIAINILLLIISFGVAITGLTKKIGDIDGRPWWRRMTLAGWAFIALITCGLALGIHKEAHSFDARLRATYPRFEGLIKDVTGYDSDSWRRYSSYRLALRLLLQKAHRRAFADGPPETLEAVLSEPARSGKLPPSMEQMLSDLGKAGVVDDALCRRLDYVRWYTYTTEWGDLGKMPSDAILSRLGRDGESALNELDRLVPRIAPETLHANATSVCGTAPND